MSDYYLIRNCKIEISLSQYDFIYNLYVLIFFIVAQLLKSAKSIDCSFIVIRFMSEVRSADLIVSEVFSVFRVNSKPSIVKLFLSKDNNYIFL